MTHGEVTARPAEHRDATGPGVLPSDSLERWLPVHPLWWRIPAWVAMTVLTVLAAPDVLTRTLAGVFMAVGATALQLISHDRWHVRVAAMLVATSFGTVACFASHSGIAEVLVLVAASRAPGSLDGKPLAAFTAAAAGTFGVTVAVVSGSWLGLFAAFAVPALIQRSVDHRDLVRERDRATALLVEADAGREAVAQAAALRERGRIAREMHDVLAHSLAGLSVQLQAVRSIAARQDVGPDVLGPIDTAAALARDGLAEARAAVGALRDPVGLGLDAVPRLVERTPGDVALSVDGDPGAVGAEAGHAVYRAVQEALTNAARYAPGATVAVRLAWRPDALETTVTNTARVREPVDGVSTGLGLAGMSERVGSVGGSLEAGPHDGGWRVRVVVPREDAP